MSDEKNAEILDFLRGRFAWLDDRLDRIDHKLDEVITRLGIVEMNLRLDNISRRLERVERRLELADEHALPGEAWPPLERGERERRAVQTFVHVASMMVPIGNSASRAARMPDADGRGFPTPKAVYRQSNGRVTCWL
jgi:hypothetical protein